VAGAGLGTVMVAWHVPVEVHLLAVAVVVGTTIPVATRSFLRPGRDAALLARLAAAADEDAGEPASGLRVRRSPLAAWTESRTVLIGLFVLCMTVVEGVGDSWLNLGVIGGYHAAAVIGSATLAVFLAAMTGGRWFGPRLIDRYGRVRTLRAGAATALAGLLLVGLGHFLPAAIAGALLIGLGISLGFPVGMSAAADDPRFAAGRVSVASSLGYVSFLAGPPVIGALADRLGVLHAVTVTGVLLVAALFLCRATAPLAARNPGSGPRQPPGPDSLLRTRTCPGGYVPQPTRPGEVMQQPPRRQAPEDSGPGVVR
jgi:hypothetical protein